MSKRELAGLGYGFLGAGASDVIDRPRKRTRMSYADVPLDLDIDTLDQVHVEPPNSEGTSSVKTQKKAQARVATQLGHTASKSTAEAGILVVRFQISPVAFSDLLKRLEIPHGEVDVTSGAELPRDLDEKSLEVTLAALDTIESSHQHDQLLRQHVHDNSVLEPVVTASSTPLSSVPFEFYHNEPDSDVKAGAEDAHSRFGRSFIGDTPLSLINSPNSTNDGNKKLEELEQISRSIIKLSLSTQKPPPAGKPLVYADGKLARADLCESLPYFRAFKSAEHKGDGFSIGFLFDGGSDGRDIVSTNVVIAHGGGGLKVVDKKSREPVVANTSAKSAQRTRNTTRKNTQRADTDADAARVESPQSRDTTKALDSEVARQTKSDDQDRKMARTQSQEEGNQQRNLANNMKMSLPIAIIVGDKHPNVQFKIPHRSDDLGVYRYRFERLSSASPCWWKPRDVEEPVELGDLGAPERQTCESCEKSCEKVYLNGWMCTQAGCKSWWTLADGSRPEESDLLYDPAWLMKKTDFPPLSPPFKTRPDPWILKHDTAADAGFVWQATRGIVCQKCGRCGVRKEWSRWVCGNSACGEVYQMPKCYMEPRHLIDYYNPVDYGLFSHFDDKYLDPGCHLEDTHDGNWRNLLYTIPGIDCEECWILHMAANQRILEEKGGPNDMFSELQRKDIGLMRRSIGGDGITNQFTKNFGMPYKFVADVASESFDNAPKAVHDARARMNWAVRQILGEDNHADFNECMVLGYFEDNTMKYHDDGEKGLGPTIATLSLGGTARMTIRMKKKHYQGVMSGKFIDRKPFPGCLKEKERLAAWTELEKLGPAERAQRMKTLPKELGLGGIKNASVLLDMKVNHGDIVIMHGRLLQEIYEHQVKPLGKLRFALTCRNIELDSLKTTLRPDYEVEDEETPRKTITPDSWATSMPRFPRLFRVPPRYQRRARRSRIATMLLLFGVIFAFVTPFYCIYKPPTFLISYFQRRWPDVLFQVSTKSKVVALTIDDAPSEHTNEIMDVLKENGAKATFFVIGSQVPGREDILRRLVINGNELGNHAMHDEPSRSLSDSALIAEMQAVDKMIHDAYSAAPAPSPPKYFRPGSGFFSDRMRKIASNLGYRLVLGGIYPHDPQIPYWSINARHILSMIRPGGIIICHDRRSWTLPMLKKVLPEMKTRGYRVVSVTELLNEEQA
ncbi:hypothetical protein FKW77_001848 [Venturia effusa]|uniref:chitin deacetylase n=1 Tax=Venturia effusa TaxID=50376 RepID=A0A517L6Q7_9PEZI|nr:hypothetical protein FKW77_001848 [Venturia effusa]